jgi:hypothetical protein
MKGLLLNVLFFSASTLVVFWIGGALLDFRPSEYWVVLLAGAILGVVSWLRDAVADWIGNLTRTQSDDD